MNMIPSKVKAPSGSIPSDEKAGSHTDAAPTTGNNSKSMPKGFGGGLIPGKIKG